MATGVYFDKRRKNYAARVTLPDGTRKYVGTFKTLEDAEEAVFEAQLGVQRIYTPPTLLSQFENDFIPEPRPIFSLGKVVDKLRSLVRK